MPTIDETPDTLSAYTFHGLIFTPPNSSGESTTDCPFCGREGKFYVSVHTGVWQCKRCQAGSDKGGGNASTFIRLLHEESRRVTTDFAELARERRLLSSDTLSRWGLCQSIITDDWLIPAYNLDGKLNQLYRYARVRKGPNGWGNSFLPTPGLIPPNALTYDDAHKQRHGLMGFKLFDTKKRNVFLCEGPWDAMCVWEVLRLTAWTKSGYVLTSSEKDSLYSSTSVIAVPSCNVFYESWRPLFADKVVTFFYDNDYPLRNKVTEKVTPPAAWMGMQRAAQVLIAAEVPPAEMYYIQWDPDGKDHNRKLHHGYDVRDAIARIGANTNLRVKYLGEVLNKVRPVLEEWTEKTPRWGEQKDKPLDPLPCQEWSELVNSWRLAMKWHQGLNDGLAVMLACAASTKTPNDQLWIKVMSPPSTGKSTLAEGLAVARKFVKPVSTLTGLVSGHKGKNGSTDDHSLIVQAHMKCLIVKDSDTLLQMGNLDKIMSEMRDVYDGTIRTYFKNDQSRDYENVLMTMCLCGTSALRKLDESELGQRFINFDMMDRIDLDQERAIVRKRIRQATMSLKLNGEEGQWRRDTPEERHAKQLTGGYLIYLRENMLALLDSIHVSPEVELRIEDLAIFVAHARARPSKRQDEVDAHRELSARLGVQLHKLATCLAIVMNRKEVDAEVMRVVTKAALDTSRGRVLQLIRLLHESGEQGSETKTLSGLTHDSGQKFHALLRFMRELGIIEPFSRKIGKVTSKPKWRLTDTMRALYEEVIGA
jgi:hypothetical protein